MTRLLPCPTCNRREAAVLSAAGVWSVVCRCGRQGDEAPHRADAVARWNAMPLDYGLPAAAPKPGSRWARWLSWPAWLAMRVRER